MTANEIRKGDLAELRIEDLAFGGRGIARPGGMVVFVEGALPGDVVRARITKRKSSFAEARAVEILQPSPRRVAAPCPSFGTCGGCRWQDFGYADQLRTKQQHVAEALRHIGGQGDLPVREILPSPDPWNYRNKMEFSFGRRDDGGIELGLHKAGSFQTIIGVNECHIQAAGLNPVLRWMQDAVRREAGRAGAGFVPYNPNDHTGFLRHLILRHSRTTGHFLVALLTAGGKWNGAERLGAELMAAFPECRGFLWGTNDTHGDVARLESLRHQAGDGWIEERLGDLTFRVSTFSFFQTNTRGAGVLYSVVRDFCELTGTETVLDAYCGTGTIGIFVSPGAEKVVGIELVRDAVWDARANAAANGAANCTFLAGDMRDVLPRVGDLAGVKQFDRVIVDPPRGGMEKRALRHLLDLRAPLMVYVSCNPATLARDIVTLSEVGYRVEDVQPVDMFPHTYHVESVLKLRLASQP